MAFINKKGKWTRYPTRVFDTNLNDTSDLDIAVKIKSEKLDQKVVMVTTSIKEHW